jgi:protease-4
VARGNTITGSIGVIFQWADVEKLLTTVGVKMEEVKSGELKAEPNLFGPPSERVLQVTNEMVQDSFRWFAGLVAERRGVPESQIINAQGRVYTGRQALQEKLVDAIGGEEAALKWLRETRSVPASLEVVTWRPRRELDGFGFGFDAAQGALEAAGLGGLARAIREQARAVELDGLLSLWQAPR